jgi:hypothetical protein
VWGEPTSPGLVVVIDRELDPTGSGQHGTSDTLSTGPAVNRGLRKTATPKARHFDQVLAFLVEVSRHVARLPKPVVVAIDILDPIQPGAVSRVEHSEAAVTADEDAALIQEADGHQTADRDGPDRSPRCHGATVDRPTANVLTCRAPDDADPMLDVRTASSASITSVTRAHFFDPVREERVERDLAPGWGVDELVRSLLALSSGRGSPAAELIRPDGSSVSIGTDGEWATLIWTDSLGTSFHSVGQGASTALIYDYFGSWSEAPPEAQVPLAEAVQAAKQYVSEGSPVTESVLFIPD